MRSLIFLAVVVCVHSSMILLSSEFSNDQMIPGDFGCDTFSGVDRDLMKPSPPLFWVRPPEKTQSFVLLVDDMDNGNAVQWIVVDIPKDVTFLSAGSSGTEMPNGAVELTNSYNMTGYAGLCPSNETHQYRFRLFAMDRVHTDVILPTDITKMTSDDITAQLIQNNLYTAVLTGHYYAAAACPVSIEVGQPCPCPGPTCPKTVCPVEIKEGEECPCPGPKCTVGAFNIRYTKPSEALKPHNYSTIQNPINEQVKETICSRPDGENRAQTELSTVIRPPIVSVAAPNAMVEDVPMPLEERLRRHLRLEGMTPTDLNLLEVEEGNGNEKEVVGDDEEMVWVQDDLVVSSPLGPESGDSGIRKCSVDSKRGCKRIKRFKRYSMTMWSPAHSTGENTTISPNFLCNAYHNASVQTTSPPFSWRHAPRNTKSYVLILDDVSPGLEDDDFGNILWLVSNIPKDVSIIPEGAAGTTALPSGAQELVPFTAPCPRRGSVGTFRCRVFALDRESIELKVSSQPPNRSKLIEHQMNPLETAAIQMNFLP
eukprot:c9753_g1_i1.p1 GENE.c9753_g1_i1~~c9753_g1_i1.p1  ORF type:complete len:556 (-),score=146.53 c9753_g1_i1:1-1617(-)